jgi:hypothetical protein
MVATRKANAQSRQDILLPFSTKAGDVASIVQSLRDLAYMLECNHATYIDGGVSATPTQAAKGNQIQILVDARLTMTIQNDPCL